MRIDVITLFPDMIDALRSGGVTARALQRGLVALQCWNPRTYATPPHHSVDDRPYGGGPGMVMRSAPIEATLADIHQASPHSQPLRIYLSPQGSTLDQALATHLARHRHLVLLCGRYEGIDQRLINHHIDFELSIGDYVLSGGELAAMVLIDALTRLQAGALGSAESAAQDSFCNDRLDCPHYTRPECDARDQCVPDVLRSGDHRAIERWRHQQAIGRTWQRRPDLLSASQLNDEQRTLLDEFLHRQVRCAPATPPSTFRRPCEITEILPR